MSQLIEFVNCAGRCQSGFVEELWIQSLIPRRGILPAVTQPKTSLFSVKAQDSQPSDTSGHEMPQSISCIPLDAFPLGLCQCFPDRLQRVSPGAIEEFIDLGFGVSRPCKHPPR